MDEDTDDVETEEVRFCEEDSPKEEVFLMEEDPCCSCKDEAPEEIPEEDDSASAAVPPSLPQEMNRVAMKMISRRNFVYFIVLR